MLAFVVNRYKDSPNLIAWQVENEPFLITEKLLEDGSFIKRN